jgi:hypothetical protein
VVVDKQPAGAAGWRGRYSGTRLIYRDDGALVELAYSGAFTTVPGEVSAWKADEGAIPAAAAAARYDLDAIFAALHRALEAQADGAAARKAAELRAGARRLRDVATLVRKW